jgi:hypothetical protein
MESIKKIKYKNDYHILPQLASDHDIYIEKGKTLSNLTKFFSKKKSKNKIKKLMKQSSSNTRIVEKIVNDTLNRIYILKHDMYLSKIYVQNKVIYVMFPFYSNITRNRIKINKNSIIKIIKPTIITSSLAKINDNYEKLLFNTNITCNIIDLNIDYHQYMILNDFDEYINNKVNDIPIIVNELFNYMCDLEQLFNFSVPSNLEKQINDKFVVKYDERYLSTNNIIPNSILIKPIDYEDT